MFYSCGRQPAKLKYEIYDKELLAFFEAFQQWCNYLEGSAHVVLVLSDHKNIEYFMTTKQLTHHQVHWLECLSGFNYLIHYHAGWLGTKPDALTHHEDVYPWERMLMHWLTHCIVPPQPWMDTPGIRTRSIAFKWSPLSIYVV